MVTTLYLPSKQLNFRVFGNSIQPFRLKLKIPSLPYLSKSIMLFLQQLQPPSIPGLIKSIMSLPLASVIPLPTGFEQVDPLISPIPTLVSAGLEPLDLLLESLFDHTLLPVGTFFSPPNVSQQLPFVSPYTSRGPWAPLPNDLGQSNHTKLPLLDDSSNSYQLSSSNPRNKRRFEDCDSKVEGSYKPWEMNSQQQWLGCSFLKVPH